MTWRKKRRVLSWFASRDDGHWIDQVVFLVRLDVVDAVVFVVFWAFCTALRHDQLIVLHQLLTDVDLPQQHAHQPAVTVITVPEKILAETNGPFNYPKRKDGRHGRRPGYVKDNICIMYAISNSRHCRTTSVEYCRS